MLAQHYKFVLLEGPQKNEEHKCLHDCVRAVPGSSAEAATASASAAALLWLIL